MNRLRAVVTGEASQVRGMIDKVRSYIQEQQLFAPGDTAVVAVSGGADSVALLDMLTRLPELRLRLVVAHLNHSLRGAESDGDEAFVRTLADGHGLPVRTKVVDVAGLARRDRLSLEDAGRVARHAFFDEVAAVCAADRIVLAHHADDQAETVLMRLLRGCGTTGLSAIAPKGFGGRYVRPLLAVTRGEIESYLHSRSLVFRVDRSNTDTSILRNRVRHELIPLLADYNPAVAERLAVTAELLHEDERLLERLASDAFARLGTAHAGQAELTVPGVSGEPRGLRLRLYRHAICQVKGNLQRIASRHLFAIDQLVRHSRPQAMLDLPDDTHVERRYERLLFRRGPKDEDFAPYSFTVTTPGTYPIPGGGWLTVTLGSARASQTVAARHQACFDLDRTPFPWQVRTFRPGDRFVPSGMSGSKKVKKLLIDEKVPVGLRRRIPLLFCGSTLIWVTGLRESAAACTEADAGVPVRVEIRDFTPLRT